MLYFLSESTTRHLSSFVLQTMGSITSASDFLTELNLITAIFLLPALHWFFAFFKKSRRRFKKILKLKISASHSVNGRNFQNFRVAQKYFSSFFARLLKGVTAAFWETLGFFQKIFKIFFSVKMIIKMLYKLLSANVNFFKKT